jgi:hypothetical protein
MSTYTNFEIQVLNQQLHCTQPPQDELGELTPLKLGLWWFCYERNRPVQLTIGPIEEHLELDTDFSLELPYELPSAVGALQRGNAVQLHFAEAQLELELMPRGDIVDAKVATYGYHISSTALTLRTSEVLGALRAFVEDMIGQALRGGYIREANGAEALKPLLPTGASEGDAQEYAHRLAH